jgi:phage terminase large subunit-like protein
MRRFLKARVYVPRKNGKTLFVSGLGVYMLAFDREPGAEVYAGAGSEKQADEVFKPSRLMCLANSQLTEAAGININAQSLTIDDGSKYERLIGSPGDGASPHFAIIDEFHEHRTSELIDTMETGMGARRQPISFVISTAGSNTAGPCREDWKACERVLEGTKGFEDETLFAIIYTIDQGDAWDSVQSLMKANPNWGVSINAEQMEAKLRTAKQRANQQSSFRTKHLNEWVSTRDAYFNIVEWQKCAKQWIKPENFKQYPCVLACDLSVKHDLTVVMQLFILPEKRYAVFGKYFLPEETIDLPENQHYRNWHIGGHLETSGETVVDYGPMKDHIMTLCREYNVLEIPADPWNGWQVLKELTDEGAPIIIFNLITKTMNEPMKELDALIRSGRIQHNGDPILEWAIGNTTGREDPNGNVFPRKDDVRNKIDPVVGTIMALGRAMLKDDSPAGPLVCF